MKSALHKLPPGQVETTKFPVVNSGTVPRVELTCWDFHMYGLVKEEKRFSWKDISELPKYSFTADAHCVTTWSRLDNQWEGVALHTLMSLVDILPEARFVLVHSENTYTVNLRLEDLMREGVMLAYKHDGEPLSPEHGFPARLIVPHLYFWKSAKWVRGVEFLSESKAGFWEQRGYHFDGDPQLEQRYSR